MKGQKKSVPQNCKSAGSDALKHPYFTSLDEFMVSRHRFGSVEPGSGLKSKYLPGGDT